MRKEPVVAAALCASMLAMPAVAHATNQQSHEGEGAAQALASEVEIETTDALASNYVPEAGDYVLTSTRFTGNAGPFSHTFNVPDGYSGNTVVFYIEHSDGNAEVIAKTVPDGDEPTVDVDVTVDGETIVTEVLELWDKIPSASYNDYGRSPSYDPTIVQKAYEDYALRLSASLAEADGPKANATLIAEDASSASALDDTSMLEAVPSLPNSDTPAYYSKNYRAPKNGGSCLGTFRYAFELQEDEPDVFREPSVGFTFQVGTQYANMIAKVYIDTSGCVFEGGITPKTATHAVRVSESGTVTVPYGEFLPMVSDDGDRYFSKFTLDAQKRNGLVSINVEPPTTIDDVEVTFFGCPQESTNDSGMRLSIEKTDLPLQVSQLSSLNGGYVGTGMGLPYEQPRPGGFCAGRLEFSAVPYGERGSSGHITLKVELGRKYAGRKATVYSGETWAPDIIEEIKSYTIDDEGTIYVSKRCTVEKQPDSDLEIALESTPVYAIVNVEPAAATDSTDIGKSASIAPIPDQKWTGSPITPRPVVTIGDDTLAEGTDYTLSYENNVDAGVATVVVTGTGSYTGELRASFKIVKDGEDADSDDPGEPDEPSDEPCDGGDSCPSHSFSDVIHGAWYHGPVDWAVENGIITGYADGTFGPNDPLSRAQMATILWRLAGEPPTLTATLPSDCDGSAFYRDAVAWALEEGIFHGNADGTFAPADGLTREQAAVVLYNRAGQPDDRADISGYRDAGSVSPFAEDAMSWAVAEGILSGTADGSLEPTRACSRAELAALLMRMDRAGVL